MAMELSLSVMSLRADHKYTEADDENDVSSLSTSMCNASGRSSTVNDQFSFLR